MYLYYCIHLELSVYGILQSIIRRKTMKAVKSAVGILLTLCMLTGMIPLSALPAQAKESKSVITVSGDNTDLTIDFDYPYTNQNDAMADARKFESKTVDETYYQNNSFNWKHTHTMTVRDNDEGSVRQLLTSTDPADKYVALDGNADRGYYKDVMYEPIKITTDKVFDLNGYALTMRYDSNRKNDKTAQTTVPKYHNCHMFEIEKGATLTIIDSSRWRNPNGKGTGSISFTGYMINPFKCEIRYYTTRDMFWVNNGNLVIYGGTFQAGRQKQQVKSNFSWSKLKTVIGSAVSLGVSIAEYATGISAADAARLDLNESFKNLTGGDTGDDDGTEGEPSTNKKTGEGAPDEKKESTPQSGADDSKGKGRNQTVDEKEKGKGDKKNESNKDNTAKNDKNTKIAEAEKKVVDATLNKDKISSMVDKGFELVDGIVGMIGNDEKSRMTQSIFGTVVHVGNAGTFVSYDGTYKGYGSSPNNRNAVIEVTRQKTINKKTNKYFGGLAYIYGGTFEAYSGSNVFNFVKANDTQTFIQHERDQAGNMTTRSYVPHVSETNGLQNLFFENEDEFAKDNSVTPIPLDTRNVMVKGGTFRNYYEYMNVGLGDESNGFTKFPGTAGCVNLGIDSFNRNFIRDGRIQVVDKYGDGALVLMDEHKGENDEVYHYRLFCGDTELRYKQYLEVYPNTSLTNSNYSFKLKTQYEGEDATDLSKSWENDGENERTGAYNQTEKVFTYPLDSVNSANYFVVPDLTDTDVKGENLDASDVWYYNTPVDQNGKKIDNVVVGDFVVTGKSKVGNNSITLSQHFNSEAYININTDYAGDAYKAMMAELNNKANAAQWASMFDTIDPTTRKCSINSYNYKSNLKWFRYRIYRVDPLTRENISESGVYGEDVPLGEAVYGASNDSLKCKLPLRAMEAQIKRKNSSFKGYKPGDMYRIVFDVDELLNYDYDGNGTYHTKLDAAKCESSMLFRCYNTDELKDLGGETKVEDYTPLQWVNEPKYGQSAKIQINYGKAGQVDYLGRKIFDVYYQWYAVDDDGNKELIAGTDNIYKGDLANKKYHTYEYWKVGSDGHKYVNTIDPDDPNKDLYGDNGLPINQKKWTAEMLHAYTHEMTTATGILNRDPNANLSLANNRYFATNTDTCYIPKELEGKKIFCKATVVNLFWPKNYDKVQVFYSHLIDPDKGVLKGSLDVKKTGSYVSSSKPATLTLNNVRGLYEDEYITDVIYYGYGKTKEYTGLKLTAKSAMPSAKFPQDFFEEKRIPNLSAYDYKVYAQYRTNTRRNFFTAIEILNYEVEAKTMRFTKDEYKTTLEKLKSGQVESGKVWILLPDPMNSSIGFDYNDFKATNESVATLNDKGRLVFGGKTGKSVITVNCPDKVKKSLTVTVTDEIPIIEVSGIKAPTVGEKFDLTAEVPKDARYKVKEVYWTDTNTKERMPADAVAEDYHSYSVHVNVVQNDEYNMFKFLSPFKLTATLADGTEDIKEGKANWSKNFALEYSDEDSFHTDKGWFHYDFLTISGASSNVIEKVFINYPTETESGDSVADWKDKVEIQSNGSLKFDTKIKQAFTKESSDILLALGYKNCSDEYIGNFIEGVQCGISVQLDIPEALTAKFDNKVKVYLNGEERSDVEVIRFDTSLYVTSYNTVNVKSGKIIDPMPVYHIKPFEISSGEKISLNDLLVCDDSSVELSCSGDFYATDSKYDANEYIEYDAESNTLKAKKEFLHTYTYSGKQLYEKIGIPLLVTYDPNHDGNADMTFKVTEQKIIYAKKADKPALPADKVIKVTVMNPDGTVFSSENMTVSGTTISVQIPEDTFISGAKDSSRYTVDYRSGADKINIGGSKDGDEITITTAPIDSIKFFVGADGVESDCGTIQGINLSVDGSHWMSGGRIKNLDADTSYVLSYKQGINGNIYSKVIKTASESFEVFVGKTQVTDENTGDLEKDGWHYDIPTGTLTLKDFSLESDGVVAEYISIAGLQGIGTTALIYSAQPITIELIGNNKLKKNSGSGLSDYVIYSPKKITITGNGNLALTGCDYMSRGIVSDKGDIYLEGTGKLSFNNVGYGFAGFRNEQKEYDTTVYYINGEIEYIPCYVSEYSVYIGALIYEKNTINTSKAVHSFKIYGGEKGDTLCDASDLADLVKKQSDTLRLVPDHICEKEIATPEAYVSGDCSTGVTYYKSCACGHIDSEKTFTTDTAEHKLVHHDGQNATCTTDGWAEYETCENCSYSTYQEIPANGHSFIHHDRQDSTCEQKGYEAYDECENCGVTTYKELPLADHNITLVSGKAATCEEDGSSDHYECTVCKKCFNNEAGEIEISADSVNVPAIGHNWGEWKVSKEPTETTEGEEERICQNNSEHKQTRSIEKLSHKHTLRFVEEVPATCEAEGKRAYYICEDCQRIFEDEAATKEINAESLGIPALGHDWGEWKVTKPATEEEVGEETRVCNNDPAHTEKREIAKLEHTHSLKLVEEVPATCTAEGTEEYYVCEKCGKLYSDRDGTNEITKPAVISKEDHDLSFVDEVAATTTKTGVKAHYKCDNCGRIFEDEDGKTEITDSQSLVIPTIVVPAVKATLSAKKATLKAGAVKTLKVNNGTAKSWKTSNKSVATVTAKGKITALKKGKAVITATLKDGTKLKCTVTVSTSPTIKIGTKKFSASKNYTVKKNGTLTVTITGKAASVKNVYTTTNKKIAKVTSSATAKKIKIKAGKKGSAIVTVKVNGVAFRIKVTVK